jgi:hypothetical protein
MCSRCANSDDLLQVNLEIVCLTCISKFNIAPLLSDEQEQKLIADCSCIPFSSITNSLSLVSAIRIHGFFVHQNIRYYTIGDLVFYDSPLHPVARLFYNHIILWF